MEDKILQENHKKLKVQDSFGWNVSDPAKPPKKTETTSLSIKVPHNCKNNMRPVGTYGNYIKKCPDVIENVAQILIRMVLLNRG